MSAGPGAVVRVRTVFISDVHLGTHDCRTDLLLDFLHRVHSQQLVLVGDIIDLWSLRRNFYWPQSHSDVLRALLGKTKHGTRVIYIPGNHDQHFRHVCGTSFGNLEVLNDYLHETLRGTRLLVTHGDEFDGAVQCSRWLAAVGCGAYDVALGLNRSLNALRRRFGHGYWSLAGYLKHRIGNAVKYVRSFELAAARAARHRAADGIVCGHIHRPELREIEGVLYCNDGDWVDSCSALIEDFRGELELWHWGRPWDQQPARAHARALAAAA